MDTQQSPGGLSHWFDRLNFLPGFSQGSQALQCVNNRAGNKPPFSLQPGKCRDTLNVCAPPGQHDGVTLVKIKQRGSGFFFDQERYDSGAIPVLHRSSSRLPSKARTTLAPVAALGGL